MRICDLGHASEYLRISRAIVTGRVGFISFAIPCGSFSILRIRGKSTSRSKSRPWGLGTCAGEKLGNRLAKLTLKLIGLCLQHHVLWVVENPRSSRLFILPQFEKLMMRTDVEVVDLDMCQFGLCDPVSMLKFRKATRLVGNVPGLSSLSRKCPGDHKHQHVEDSVVVEGRSVKRSKLAGEYPKEYCRALATLVRKAVNAAALSRATRHDRKLLCQ